ncbi:MAG: universal stress protein [Deltaproteobacteria bacterium]|nr:universal stress protein [Deltaproteobacteria bacterium]
MTTVLLAYDASSGARAALKKVAQLFPGCSLCLVQSVVPPDPSVPPAAEPPRWDELTAATERDLVQLAQGAGFTAPTAKVLVGDAADMILQAAADVQPDVLVLGTHERSAVARLLLGSVAEQVAHRAACPVLLVRARRDHP